MIATDAKNTAMDANLPQASVSPPSEGMVTLAHLLYGLHGFSALMGVLSSAFIVTAFLTGWPSIIAVIINYVKRGDARGTWLDSHFGWQIRTFWYALVWVVLAGLLLQMRIDGVSPETEAALPLFVAAGLMAIAFLLSFRILRMDLPTQEGGSARPGSAAITGMPSPPARSSSASRSS